MSRNSTQEAAVGRGSAGLKKGLLGPVHIAFFVAAAAGPLLVMTGMTPVTLSLGGSGTPFMFLACTALFMLFAVGYVSMSKHIQDAGAFYSFISSGFNRPSGAGSAFVILLAYNLVVAGTTAGAAFFAHNALLSVSGIDIHWLVFAVLFWLLIGVLGANKITASAKVLGVFLTLEVLILLAFAIPTIAQGGATGLSLEPFNPMNVDIGVFAALGYVLGAFFGCEATVVYSEEAKDPQRTIPRATYGTILFLGLFYAFVSWAIVEAFGPANVMAAAQADPVNLVFDAAYQFAGPVVVNLMLVLLSTGAFASALGFHNEATRYFFSLGRAGVLPEWMARVRPKNGAPWVAVVAQSAFSAVVLIVLIALGADAFTGIFIPLTAAGSVGIIAMQALTSLAVVSYFRKNKDLRPSLWAGLIAPTAAGLLFAVGLVLMIGYFGLLSGAEWSSWVNYALLGPYLVVFVAGVLIARRSGDRTVDAEAQS